MVQMKTLMMPDPDGNENKFEIVDADARSRLNSHDLKLDNYVTPEMFGAVGDGETDDSLAFTEMLNFAISNNKMVVVPSKTYLIASKIQLSNLSGFTMIGTNMRKSVIAFSGENSLFEITLYLYVNISNITLKAISQNATCFTWYGNGGGNTVNFRDCYFDGWKIVESTPNTASVGNDDNHKHYNCIYQNNESVWVNNNTQAVIWTYIACKFYHNYGNIFENPAENLSLAYCDFINSGVLLHYSISSYVSAYIYCSRFETYQNIDPSSAPKIAVGSQNSTGQLVINRCSMDGVSLSDSKPILDIHGRWRIIVKDCSFSQKFQITWDSSAGSNYGLTTAIFENCEQRPNITLVPASSQGNRFGTTIINNCGSINNKVSRVFYGSVQDATMTYFGDNGSDVKMFTNVLSSSTPKDFEIKPFIIAPYKFAVTKVEALLKTSTQASITISILNANKDTVIGSKTVTVTADDNMYLEFIVDSIYELNPADSYYVRISSANNATITGFIKMNYGQTNIR